MTLSWYEKVFDAFYFPTIRFEDNNSYFTHEKVVVKHPSKDLDRAIDCDMWSLLSTSEWGI